MLQRYGRKTGMGSRGQTLIVTLLVMFVLAVIATVFIALVSSNLISSQTVSKVDAVGQFAQSGIDYANSLLTAGEDGGDWRPVPDNNGVTNVPNPVTGVVPVAAADWVYQRDNYPDFEWTRAYWPQEFFPAGYSPAPGEIGCAGPSGGYTTFKTGQGRFLLKISYDPDPDDAISKYIRIDSVGRWGQGIETLPSGEVDPTTLKGGGPDDRIRKLLTAYKPIGITDFGRFITNKDNRGNDFALSLPGFRTVFGRMSDDYYGYRSGPIWVNGNLKIYGDPDPTHTLADGSLIFYLRGKPEVDGSIVPIDSVSLTGDLTFDDNRATQTDPKPSAWIQIMTASGTPIGGPTEVQASNPRFPTDLAFTTVGSFLRDGSGGTDASNRARGIKRLEPPIIDQSDLTNTTLRYRILTLNSGQQVRVGTNWVNLGKYGYGRGVYIDNFGDVQDESETLFGGYTLRSDWLNPNNLMSPYWKGQFYIPPGVSIRLNPIDTDGDGQPDFTVTRTDGKIWYDASGNPRPDWGNTIRMPYPDPNNGRILSAAIGGTGTRISGNGVIYAEGNVRIRGMLPANMQLTIVSNENIYIEGNILKNRTGTPTLADPWRGADERCGLSLLARKNVVVNTSMFFAPVDSVSPEQIGSDAQNGEPPYHVIVNNDPDSRFRQVFEFGPFESDEWWKTTPAPTGEPNEYQLLLRHGGQFGASYINTWLNPGSNAVPDYGILSLNVAPYPLVVPNGLPSYVWGVGDDNFNPAGWGLDSVFAGNVFDITPVPANNINSSLDPVPGYSNMFQVSLDHSYYTRANYLLGGMAVQPMDIRIEAVMYAQEGSFFVIPGAWFNPNPSDPAPANDADRPTTARPDGIMSEFPFFGDPLDIRIIIDGAVSENMPATVSDVAAWMEKWGSIPPTYGSSGRPTAHPGEGLTFLYDDHAGFPLVYLRGGGTRNPIRTDAFGRALPFTPRLPVSRTLIYSGDLL